MAELSAGGEALLQRLAEINASNEEFRRQLDTQAKDVVSMEESSRIQQQRIVQYEKQAERMRQDAAAAAEARVREENAGMEERLLAEIEAARSEAKREREEMLERLQRAEDDRRRLEVEAVEARKLLRSAVGPSAPIAASAMTAGASNEVNETRTKPLEMELNLLRQRLARETEGRQAAERACNDANVEQRRLKGELERSVAESWRLKRLVTEQTDLASFREEQCNDLHVQFKAQQQSAEERLAREKEKFHAINRLEGLLPKHMLVRALY
jgi:hypothetical protein